MPLTSHVYRHLRLSSFRPTQLVHQRDLSLSSTLTAHRHLTCLAHGAASLSIPRRNRLSSPPHRAAHLHCGGQNSADYLTQLALPLVRSAVSASSLPLVTSPCEGQSVQHQQQRLYELVKRTRTDGESDADYHCAVVWAKSLFACILKDASWADNEREGMAGTASEALLNAFTPLLRTAGPAIVPLLIQTLWCVPPINTTTDSDSVHGSEQDSQSLIGQFFSPGPRRALSAQRCPWHPAVPLELVKVCLQSTAHAVRVKRNATNSLSPALLAALHEVILCGVPFPSHDRSEDVSGSESVGLREELAVLAMTALKGAPCTLLCELYAYLESARLCTVPVMNKFLASCGWTVSNVSSRGQQPLCAAETALILRAVNGLVEASDSTLEATQEGLIYCVPALVAAGLCADVVALYRRLPELRETPQSVMARVHLQDVHGAVEAVRRLANSRPEGWVAVSPMVLQTLAAVARLVGGHGAANEVAPFYTAVVTFHNASMIVGQLVEQLLAGLGERIESLPRLLGPLHHVAPRQALEEVLPTLKATVRYIGDDLNADPLFGLVESALQVEHMSVPLTTAIVWCLAHAEAMSIRSLFHRVDASTGGMPFLQYYALCYTRDLGDRATHDHLAAVWHVNGDAVWLRDGQLATPYKLWKCTACGRLNSDRFNYCLCSSLRSGFVICAQCGYGQDEREFVCRCCGSALQEGNTYTAVSRKAWTCSDCRATNPARQVLTCLRCRKLTGPATVALHPSRSATQSQPASLVRSIESQSPHMPRCCTCDSPSAAVVSYATATGCCVNCGAFATPYGATHAQVWRCPGCQQRRSSLERTCPHCPQVDYVPALIEGSVSALGATPRHCVACDADVANVFATHCPACGVSESSLVRSKCDAERATTPCDYADTTSTPVTDFPMRTFCVCAQCLHLEPTGTSDATPHLCTECGAPLVPDAAHTLTASDRWCSQCHTMLPAVQSGAVCPHCAAFVPPRTSPPWPAPVILSTVSTLDDLAATSSAHILTNTQQPDAFEETCSVAVGTAVARHAALEDTLVQLRAAWVAPLGSTPPHTALSVSALAPIRVDVVTHLSRLVTALGPFVRTDSHARRCVALVKQLLDFLDRRCGILSVHFAPNEVCHECLGHHPPELCPYEPLDETHTVWHCLDCGLENTNTDVGRYLCQHCLALRPVVQDMFVSECWQCERCARANVAFETYCMHCGQGRPAMAVSSTVLDTAGSCEVGESSALRKVPHDPVTSAGHLSRGAVTNSTSAMAERRNHIPFLPMKCTDCGLVYLEMRCPLCHPREDECDDDLAHAGASDAQTTEKAEHEGRSPGPAEESGVVCMVRSRYAFIQPFGTTTPEQRVHVGSEILAQTPLTVGRPVRFIAEREMRHGRRRVVVLKPQKNANY